MNQGKYYFAKPVKEWKFSIQEEQEKIYVEVMKTNVIQWYMSKASHEIRPFIDKAGKEQTMLVFKLTLHAQEEDGSNVYTVISFAFSNPTRSIICTLAWISDPSTTPVRILTFLWDNNKTWEKEQVILVYNAITNELMRRWEDRQLGDLAKQKVELIKNSKGEVKKRDYDELNNHLCTAIDLIQARITSPVVATASDDLSFLEETTPTKAVEQSPVNVKKPKNMADLPF